MRFHDDYDLGRSEADHVLEQSYSLNSVLLIHIYYKNASSIYINLHICSL